MKKDKIPFAMRMYKIYQMKDINGLIYIGSTSQELKQRYRQHLYDQEMERHNVSSGALQLDNCEMTVLEDNVPYCYKKQRERYWILNTNCVNTCTLDCDERQSEMARKYYLKHKDKLKEKHKQKYIEKHGKPFKSKSGYKYIAYDKKNNRWRYQGGLYGKFRQRSYRTKKDALAAKFAFELMDRVRNDK